MAATQCRTPAAARAGWCGLHRRSAAGTKHRGGSEGSRLDHANRGSTTLDNIQNGDRVSLRLCLVDDQFGFTSTSGWRTSPRTLVAHRRASWQRLSTGRSGAHSRSYADAHDACAVPQVPRAATRSCCEGCSVVAGSTRRTRGRLVGGSAENCTLLLERLPAFGPGRVAPDGRRSNATGPPLAGTVSRTSSPPNVSSPRPSARSRHPWRRRRRRAEQAEEHARHLRRGVEANYPKAAACLATVPRRRIPARAPSSPFRPNTASHLRRRTNVQASIWAPSTCSPFASTVRLRRATGHRRSTLTVLGRLSGWTKGLPTDRLTIANHRALLDMDPALRAERRRTSYDAAHLLPLVRAAGGHHRRMQHSTTARIWSNKSSFGTPPNRANARSSPSVSTAIVCRR